MKIFRRALLVFSFWATSFAATHGQFLLAAEIGICLALLIGSEIEHPL